eukprot:228654_1
MVASDHWLARASKLEVYVGVIAGLISYMLILMILSFIKFIVYDKKQSTSPSVIQVNNKSPGLLDQWLDSIFKKPKKNQSQSTESMETAKATNIQSHIQLSTQKITEIPKDNMTTDDNEQYVENIDDGVTKRLWKLIKFIFFIALFVLDTFDDISSLFAAKEFLNGVNCTVGPSIDTSRVGSQMIFCIFIGMIIAVLDIYLVFEELCRNGNNICCIHGGFNNTRERRVQLMHIGLGIWVTIFQDIAIMILLLIGAEQAGIVSNAWLVSFILNAIAIIVYCIKGIYDVQKLRAQHKSDATVCYCCLFVLLIIISLFVLGYGIFTAEMDTERISMNGVKVPDKFEFGDNELYGESSTDYLIQNYEVGNYTFDFIECDAIHGESISCEFDFNCNVRTTINNCTWRIIQPQSRECDVENHVDPYSTNLNLTLCYAICKLD